MVKAHSIEAEGDLRRILEIIRQINGCETPPDVHRLFVDAANHLGAEQAVFVSYLGDEESHESYYFMLAADARWCLEYKSRCQYSTDPWLVYASTHSEPVPATAICVQTADQHAAVELARKYGMVSVCIAPAPSVGHCARVGMLALGSQTVGRFDGVGFDEVRVLARALSVELHDWWSRFIRASTVRKIGLSDLDLDMLRLEMAGHGTKAVAVTLGLSEPTINTRWQRLNAKLGVPQRRHAASIAARLGLV